MSTNKKLVLAVLGLAILALLYLALRPVPVPASAARVAQGYFAEYVEDEGRTRLRDPYIVTAPIHGYLRRVALEPGDAVEAGAVLFELEALPVPALDARSREQARETIAAARARLEAAEAELENRQAQHRLAQGEYERVKTLHERKLVAVEERDRRLSQRDTARSAEHAARHAVDVARFELEAARAVLQVADGKRSSTEQPTLAVHAPISGTVTKRHRCCEGPAQAGEQILEIGDLAEDLEIQVDLLSVEAVRVRSGMRAIIERWGGGDELEGRVRRVEPSGFTRVSALGVDEQRVPVLVEITSPREAWGHLGDGFRIEARFVLWEGEDVLHIPTSALFRIDDQWSVYVVEDGRAVRRAVTIGRRSGLRTQVVDGLREGAMIITHPGDRIGDGVRVAVDIQPAKN